MARTASSVCVPVVAGLLATLLCSVAHTAARTPPAEGVAADAHRQPLPSVPRRGHDRQQLNGGAEAAEGALSIGATIEQRLGGPRGAVEGIVSIGATAAESAVASVWTSLDGAGWTVSNSTVSVPATVPGTVPDALFRAGVEGDPHFGYNQQTVLEYSTASNFTYTRYFPTPVGYAAATMREGVSGAGMGQSGTGAGVGGRSGGLIQLVFDGIDTASRIVLNGHVLGSTNNMHLQYAFDAGAALLPAGTAADNRLEVHIEPAVEYAARQAAQNGDPGCLKHNRGSYWPAKFGHDTICSTYVRKNTGSFGWDCARAFVAQGIWKSVWLRTVAVADIDEIVPAVTGRIAPDGASNQFEVASRVFLTVASACSLTLKVEGSWVPADPLEHTIALPAGRHNVSLPVLAATNVRLWWPNGFGEPSLYNITVTLSVVGSDGGSDVVAAKSKSIGFRTFDFVGSVGNNTDYHGNASLYFRVNGRPMFAKGHNWMPSTVLIADTPSDRAMKQSRLADARSVGANTIRVWGGGIYETEAFYEAADRYVGAICPRVSVGWLPN